MLVHRDAVPLLAVWYVFRKNSPVCLYSGRTKRDFILGDLLPCPQHLQGQRNQTDFHVLNILGSFTPKRFIQRYTLSEVFMAVEDKLVEVQERIERKVGGIGKGKYARIVKMARKPTKDEYIKVLLITGFGITLLGLLGFVIYLIMGVYIKVP